MKWDELASEIAQALGRNPEDIPRPGDQGFNQMLGLLLEAHPELAHRVEAWLVQLSGPASAQTEIAVEARKAEARQRLARLFTKRDPTQPHRRRINRPALLAMGFAVMMVLWFVGRLHSPPTPLPETSRPPARQAASSPQQGPPPPPPREALREGTVRGTPPPQSATPLPTPPLPLLTPRPAEAPSAAPGGAAGAPGALGKDSIRVLVGTGAQTGGATVVSDTTAAAGPTAPGASQGGTVVLGPTAQGSAGANAASPPGAQTPAGSPAPHFEIGDQFTVRLLTPIAVSPLWQALPAIAQAEDGPISGWQVVGQASQGQDGSLQIAWTQALSPDRKTTLALHGVAYDRQIGKPGVPQASSSVMAPQAARTVLSGTLSAVSQYVQAQIQAQQVQVSGITATLTSAVPPFWQFLAQGLATGFQPAPVQTGGTILVTRAAAGTPVVVFVTGLSD